MGIKGKLYGMVLLGILMMPSLCFAGDDGTIARGESPSTEYFDSVLAMIVDMCLGSVEPQVGSYTWGLFHHLVMLDFILAIIFGLLAFDGAPNFIGLFANKMMKYGFWMLVITNWRELVNRVADSLVQVGMISGAYRDIMLQPSRVIDKGYTCADNFWKFCTTSDLSAISFWKAPFFLIGLYILGLVGAIITFVAFFLIALNVFLTTAEFYICSALALIFVPFAVFDKTERFSSSAISLVIAAGAKMMVFTLMLGFMFKIVDSGEFQGLLTFKGDAIDHAMFGVAMMFVMTYFCTTAPGLAASLVSGGGGGFGSGSAEGFMGQAGSYAGKATTASGIVGGAGLRAHSMGKEGSVKAAAMAAGMGIGVPGQQVAAVVGAGLGGLAGAGIGVTKGTLQATVGGREEAMKSFSAAAGSGSDSKNKDNPKDND